MQQENPNDQPADIHQECIFQHVEALHKLAYLAEVAELAGAWQIRPIETIDCLHGSLKTVPEVANVRERYEKVKHFPEANEKPAKDEHRNERAWYAEDAQLQRKAAARQQPRHLSDPAGKDAYAPQHHDTIGLDRLGG